MNRVSLQRRCALWLVWGISTMAWQPTAVVRASEPVVSGAELRVVILSASNSHLVGQAYRRLFAQAGAAAFRHDADVGLALQANWELHAVPVRRQPPPERRSAWGLDPSRLERFLGYLEGRIGTGVPDWWETGLLNADFYPSTRLACPADKLRYEKTQAGILVPRGTKGAAAGADLAVTVGTATAAIPRFCFAESMRHSVLLDPEMCFVAIHSDSGYPFVLRRVDLASRAIVWQAEVWAVRTGFSSGSEGAHSVELRRNGKQILVFGAESHGAYLEAFDVRTGDCDFRFCTCVQLQPHDGMCFAVGGPGRHQRGIGQGFDRAVLFQPLLPRVLDNSDSACPAAATSDQCVVGKTPRPPGRAAAAWLSLGIAPLLAPPKHAALGLLGFVPQRAGRRGSWGPPGYALGG